MRLAGRFFAAASLRIVASAICRARACWYFVPTRRHRSANRIVGMNPAYAIRSGSSNAANSSAGLSEFLLEIFLQRCLVDRAWWLVRGGQFPSLRAMLIYQGADLPDFNVRKWGDL